MRCRRPQSHCYCASLPQLTTKTRVVFLQHPRERHVAIGTARMAHLSLPQSTLVEGIVLDAHPKVKKVYYPGLNSHPQHDLARKQQRGPGAMLAFDLESLDNARRFLNQVKLCSLAESLGGVETLISLPATMTHASMPADVRNRIGITEGLVRLSVGIEDVDDIIADLDQALLHI